MRLLRTSIFLAISGLLLLFTTDNAKAACKSWNYEVATFQVCNNPFSMSASVLGFDAGSLTKTNYGGELIFAIPVTGVVQTAVRLRVRYNENSGHVTYERCFWRTFHAGKCFAPILDVARGRRLLHSSCWGHCDGQWQTAGYL